MDIGEIIWILLNLTFIVRRIDFQSDLKIYVWSACELFSARYHLIIELKGHCFRY